MRTANALAVWDVSDEDWWTEQRTARARWAEDHGLPVNETYRIEFYVLDAPVARIFGYARNDAGKVYMNCAQDGPHSHADCHVATAPPHDVLLSELPPRELW